MIGDLIGRVISEKYRVDSLIRETELGDYYHGMDIRTGVPVTLRILAPAMAIDPRYVDRFLIDARSAANVRHPNVLANLETGTDPSGITFAVYQHLEGEPLKALIEQTGSLPESRALGIAKQISSALAAIHAAGLVHGGLNTEKVIITDDDGTDVARVYDLGSRPHAVNSLYAAGYLAPEQDVVTSTYDERSDVYSVGVIMYQMLTGKQPFPGATPADIFAKKSELPLPVIEVIDNVHPRIEPVIMTALAVDPSDRYQTAADLDEDIGNIATELGISLPTISSAKAAGAGVRKNIWMTAAVVIIGIGVLAAALIYGTSSRQTNPTASLVPEADSLPVQPINPATGAQEDMLSRLGDLGDASLVPAGELPPDTVPGGDGYNAWANGGVPPAGAPLAGSVYPNMPPNGAQVPQFVPPGGQNYTVPADGSSPFMPSDGGVILVPVPRNNDPADAATPTPRPPAANTQVKPSPTPAVKPATSKPSAPAANKPVKPATEELPSSEQYR